MAAHPIAEQRLPSSAKDLSRVQTRAADDSPLRNFSSRSTPEIQTDMEVSRMAPPCSLSFAFSERFRNEAAQLTRPPPGSLRTVHYRDYRIRIPRKAIQTTTSAVVVSSLALRTSQSLQTLHTDVGSFSLQNSGSWARTHSPVVGGSPKSWLLHWHSHRTCSNKTRHGVR